jgi:hypothetical protein
MYIHMSSIRLFLFAFPSVLLQLNADVLRLLRHLDDTIETQSPFLNEQGTRAWALNKTRTEKM